MEISPKEVENPPKEPTTQAVVEDKCPVCGAQGTFKLYHSFCSTTILTSLYKVGQY